MNSVMLETKRAKDSAMKLLTVPYQPESKISDSVGFIKNLVQKRIAQVREKKREVEAYCRFTKSLHNGIERIREETGEEVNLEKFVGTSIGTFEEH